MGNDLIIDTRGYVYVCGVSKDNQQDFFVCCIRPDGAAEWDYHTDGVGGDDSARAICFDSWGNVIVTGQVYNPESYNYDFLTVGLSRDNGTEIWRDFFNGPNHGDDNATDIVADTTGNIYVSGQIYTEEGPRTVTIKYRTDYFNSPPPLDSPTVANLFYPNSGQLLDTNDSLVTDSVHYYTLHHHPQLFFGYGLMNMVWYKDVDSSTTDSVQRVDVSFLNSTNQTEAYPLDQDTSSHLNYLLSHCSPGITNVKGNASLLFIDVYENIDAIYISNSEGLKLTFICNPGSNPSEIGLHLNGHSNIGVSNNWELIIHSNIGDYSFNKPRVYQIDTNDNRIPVAWILNWNTYLNEDAYFSGWSTYNHSLPLIVEISNLSSSNPMHLSGVEWGTPMGEAGEDAFTACTNDVDGNFFVTGFSNSLFFPVTGGQFAFGGSTDVIVAKFGGPASFPNSTTDFQMWTTFFGGSTSDKGFSITSTGNAISGDIYIVGETDGNVLITGNGNTNSYNQAVNNGVKDAFLLRLKNEDGGLNPSLTWSTLIGGQGDDIAKVVKCDPSGNIYIAGQTKSSATTSLCHDPTDNNFPLCHNLSSATFDNTNNGNGDGFLMMFDQNENIQLSTFYGGDGEDVINSLTIDDNSKVYLCGNTSDDSNFPLSTPAIYNQTTYGGGAFDGFLIKLNENLVYEWSTLFGGNGEDNFNSIDFDSNKDLYIGGRTSSSLPASSNVGTNPCPTVSYNCDVPPTGQYPMCDPGNDVYFQDESICNNGKLEGGFDGTIVEFNNGGELKWSTYYGGNLDDNITSLAVTDNDKVYFVGTTFSQTNFPNVIHGGPYLDSNDPPQVNSFNGFLGFFDSDPSKFHELSWASFYSSYDNFIHYSSIDEQINAISVFQEYWWIAGSTRDASTNLVSHICCLNAFQQNDVQGTDGIVARFWNGGMWMPKVFEIKNEFGSLSVFPNPANQVVKIKMKFNALSEYSLRIVNSTGKVCYTSTNQTKVFANSEEIPCENLNSGLYFIQVISKQGILSSKFIIAK